jgi:hypothetical protein
MDDTKMAQVKRALTDSTEPGWAVVTLVSIMEFTAFMFSALLGVGR